MGYVTGFAQGFSESVQAAIEKEQKSMDDLFQTQFKVRLSRRMDALEKDRDNLAEAAKQIDAYSAHTGGDLGQATQLYKLGVGYGHDKFLPQLTAMAQDGSNPLAGVVWSQANDVDASRTLDDYARAVTATPTFAPVEPLQMGGTFSTTMQKIFGSGDAAHSPAAQQSADRLSANLQSIAPGRQASTFTVGTPTLAKDFRFETTVQRVARETAQVNLEDKTLRMMAHKDQFQYVTDSLISRSISDANAATLSTITLANQAGLVANKAKLAQAQAESAELELDSYRVYGQALDAEKLKEARERVRAYTKPSDIEDAIGATLWELHEINDKLTNYNLREEEVDLLENEKQRLTGLQVSFLAHKQSIDASSRTSNPTRNLSAVNTMYDSVMESTFQKNVYKEDIMAYYDPKLQRTVYVPNSQLTGERGAKANELHKSLTKKGDTTFLSAVSTGVSVDNITGRVTINYSTEATRMIAESRTNPYTRQTFALRQHYSPKPVRETAESYMNRGYSDAEVISELKRIYVRTPRRNEAKEYIDSIMPSPIS